MKPGHCKEFAATNLLHLTALVGETVRRESEAKWQMKLSADGITWHPYLATASSDKIEFVSYLYEDFLLFEQGNAKNRLKEIVLTMLAIINTESQ